MTTNKTTDEDCSNCKHKDTPPFGKPCELCKNNDEWEAINKTDKGVEGWVGVE